MRFQQNDVELAWSYAFDFALLAAAGTRVEPGVELRVEQSGLDAPDDRYASTRIRLELRYPGIVRLDRLLARQLNVSRSCLERWLTSGRLQIQPEEKDALRKLARSGQIVIVRAAVGN